MVSLIMYAVLALGVVTFVGGGMYKYNSAITKEAQTAAMLKTCSTNYEILLGQVNKQNVAITELAKDRGKAQALAKSAMALAAKEADRNKPERDRLALLEQTFKATGACPAEEAVLEVRKGLKP
ncbi:MAG: hypothetical protein Q7J73_02765 [Dehalococcoidales bacterium]|nr:hypothetical protein [Dehalococcoidales bacterium]